MKPDKSVDWTSEEVEIIVEDYFVMLATELSGKPYNKAAHNRNVRLLLPNRTKGAVEFKHQNISAVLLEMGLPYVSGYKPLSNYQNLVVEAIEAKIKGNKRLIAHVGELVEEKILPDRLVVPSKVNCPKMSVSSKPKREVVPTVSIGAKNYLEIEARNRTIGLAGEEMIVRFERMRLWSAGKKKLSEKIEHVSQSVGDGLGYDIASFETNGRPRLIEVKTTRFGQMTPFFASRNELKFSERRPNEYNLYRVFSLTENPRFFVLKGAISDSCKLEPVSYSAKPA
jgi:hypothetical protein